MEFHEKIQQLRKNQGLTQEQLARQLFVSRTAVSKWESGRGYPNLESLKDISRLFSLSIDELLSNDELVDLAQTEKRSDLHRMSVLVFGVLDAITLAFLFLPLFGLREGDYVRAVSLLVYAQSGKPLHLLYVFVFAVLSLFGVFEIVMDLGGGERGLRLCKACSVLLHAGVILLFALSRQAYMTAFLFLQFMVKVALILRENKIK